MARMRKKADLPTKTCPVCNRPFTWRKKWAASWPEVVYCSERCRRSNHPSSRPSSRPSNQPSDTTTPDANKSAPADRDPRVGRFGNN